MRIILPHIPFGQKDLVPPKNQSMNIVHGVLWIKDSKILHQKPYFVYQASL